MLIYDTLSKVKKPFVPRKHGKVEMFVCGPTVYDSPHIGHGRSYVCFDIVAKYLTYLGYWVDFCINITDIDDKIINRAKAEGVQCVDIMGKYHGEFDTALSDLGVDSINHEVYATDQIGGMIDQIRRLEEKGIAYQITDGVYFDVSKFPEHGKLSGREGEVGLEEGDFHRVELNPEKRNPGDFVLWKMEKPGEAEVGAVWESPWGRGRPGWHIEDTAITEVVFGPQYDIHGGGIDLLFPHHECEISQMEAVSGRSPLVNYWMHNGHLKIDGLKMGKSLGNYFTIEGAMDRWGPWALRYFSYQRITEVL
jgi:cysteinyl-tRNA synthetase